MTSSDSARSARHSPSSPAPRGHGPRHASVLRTHKVRRAITMSIVAIVTFAGVGVTVAGARLQGNVDARPVNDLVKNRPTKHSNPDDPNAGKALNVLVMGSDSRGDGEDVDDGVDGMRSDTTIVVHISADRSRVELVSIPRDSKVAIPACTVTGGGTTEPRTSIFNSAFAIGWTAGQDVASAAACTISTVESLTGVYIDHYTVVDFGGFRDMVDALGGVSMCIPNDIDAPKAGNLKLTAGYQRLDGKTALKYARARTGKGLGDGSDLNRIGRQQELMSALTGQVFSQNILTDLPSLYSFLDAATSSLTTDPKLASIKNLAGLGFSLRGVRAESITFMTVPWTTDPSNKFHIVWTEEAATVWSNMAQDLPIVPPEPKPKPSKNPGSSTSPTTAAPGDEPTPEATKDAGREPFNSADITSVCG